MLKRLVSGSAIRLLPVAVALLVVAAAFGTTIRTIDAASGGSSAGIEAAVTSNHDYCTSYTGYGYGWGGGWWGGWGSPFAGGVPYATYPCVLSGSCSGYPYSVSGLGCIQNCNVNYLHYTYLQVIPYCPGPPASIEFDPNPSTVSCGSQSNLTIRVKDARGNAVIDGTPITVSTTLGYDSSLIETSGGESTISLVIPTKTSGTATITAVAPGNVQGTKNVTVTC